MSSLRLGGPDCVAALGSAAFAEKQQIQSLSTLTEPWPGKLWTFNAITSERLSPLSRQKPRRPAGASCRTGRSIGPEEDG